MREMIHTNGGEEIFLPDLPYYTDSADASTVYYLSDISANAMVEIYNALQWSPTGNVAVKLSTGEPPASNYLRPELIADLVQLVDGTIVECNTAYGGSRASTAMHYQVAEDHGFTAIAPVQIQDENGSMALPVEGGTVLSENYVGGGVRRLRVLSGAVPLQRPLDGRFWRRDQKHFHRSWLQRGQGVDSQRRDKPDQCMGR